MSQNFDREYQIPSGLHHPTSNITPIGDEFDIAFQNSLTSEPVEQFVTKTNETNVEKKYEVEVETFPLSKKLNDIHTRIDRARKHRINMGSEIRLTDNDGLFRKIAQYLFVTSVADTIKPRSINQATDEKALIHLEGIEGGKLFEKSSPDEEILFFSDSLSADEPNVHHWFYSKTKKINNGKVHYERHHFEVHPHLILCVRDSSDKKMRHEYIGEEEAKNLEISAQMYHDRIMEKIYPDYSDDLEKRYDSFDNEIAA